MNKHLIIAKAESDRPCDVENINAKLYNLYAISTSGDHREMVIINKGYCVQMAKAFMSACDVSNVYVVDGTTGEIIFDWYRF